jgi:hypothetical protein
MSGHGTMMATTAELKKGRKIRCDGERLGAAAGSTSKSREYSGTRR